MARGDECKTAIKATHACKQFDVSAPIKHRFHKQDDMAYQSIADKYDGKSVFITGATGFLGKAILEKLLYSCPGIDKIYILVREKKNMNAHQRLENILEQQLFSRLKEERPQALKKIIPINGDISEPNLGIKADDEQLLIDTVSYVFHVAATVKFNETLETAMNLNVGGTGRALNLSRRMKNIQAFVYVSTAYSNTDEKVLEERIYPAPASLNEVKKLLEIGMNEEQVKELIKNRPNTYTFTKALAENLVNENHGNVPAVIIRPSIVSSSVEEPIPGWVDNWYGATALITVICKGLNRVLLADPSNKLDLIPVDYVSNIIIVAAAKCESTKEVMVYNSATSAENPITIGNLFNLITEDSVKHKFNDLPMPFLYCTQFKWIVFLMTLLFQTIPAYILDILLILSGRKAKFTKIQSRVILVRNNVEFFTLNSWDIKATKARDLAMSLSESDQIQFPCDPTKIKWDEYIPTYCQGIRRFLCKTT